ncbi:hypothetical protein D3C84_1154430 [compost metagenome]
MDLAFLAAKTEHTATLPRHPTKVHLVRSAKSRWGQERSLPATRRAVSVSLRMKGSNSHSAVKSLQRLNQNEINRDLRFKALFLTATTLLQ